MGNSTAAAARELLQDLLKCRYSGGWGERVLQFVQRRYQQETADNVTLTSIRPVCHHTVTSTNLKAENRF